MSALIWVLAAWNVILTYFIARLTLKVGMLEAAVHVSEGGYDDYRD